MLYLVIERFRNGDPVPAYTRFHAEGRLMPAGLVYVNSWITEDLTTCYQVVDAPNRPLLEQWMANWEDLVEFEVQPVMTSPEAAARVLEPS